MLIQIDDAVAAKYQSIAAQTHVPLAKLLERQLTKFADIPAGSQVLVLSGEALAEIDQLLGLGSTVSPAALLTAVQAWAGITIGDIRLTFSPGQLAEIAVRAEKQGKSSEAIVRDIVDQLSRDFFFAPVVAR